MTSSGDLTGHDSGPKLSGNVKKGCETGRPKRAALRAAVFLLFAKKMNWRASRRYVIGPARVNRCSEVNIDYNDLFESRVQELSSTLFPNLLAMIVSEIMTRFWKKNGFREYSTFYIWRPPYENTG